jgi:hypothetical protein
MSGWVRAGRAAGWVQHAAVAGTIIASGVVKVFIAPPAMVERMAAYGLGGQLRLIGVGEMTAALLLLLPRTSSLGVLLVSAFWGGVICIHMAHGESYVFPSALLVVTWVGAYLRNPETLGSLFRSGGAKVGAAVGRPDPVLS